MLQVCETNLFGFPVVEVAGNLDMGNADILQEALLGAMQRKPERLGVDLRGGRNHHRRMGRPGRREVGRAPGAAGRLLGIPGGRPVLPPLAPTRRSVRGGTGSL